MTALAKRHYTADEFLALAIGRSRPRYELRNGELVEMAPERAGHAYTKMYLAFALQAAARAIGADVLPDGMSVKVDDGTVYEPDAIVRMGDRLGDDETHVPDPVILCEVLAPSTSGIDHNEKLKGYFTISTVRHYLIVDLKARTITHYRRNAAGKLVGDTITAGELLLDPPGLRLQVAEVFPAPGVPEN